jgi:hypothetical protein
MRFRNWLAVAGIALTGAMLPAAPALADVVLPSTGNGELVLFVRNNQTNQVYARGLGITMDQVMTQTQIQGAGAYSGPQLFNYTLPTIGPDTNLTAFLALGSSSGWSWTIMGGDSTGAVAIGDKRYVTTTTAGPPTTITGTQLSTVYNNLNGMFGTLNGFLPDPSGSSQYPDGLWGDPASAQGAAATNWFGAGPSNVNTLGDMNGANFYLLTTNGNTAAGRVYVLNDVFLMADGTLAAVPLPGALWMFGSALLGLVGVARRRLAPVTGAEPAMA